MLETIKEEIALNKHKAPYLSEWEHWKGGVYVVWSHVIIEATLEPAVVYYKRMDDPLITWCRPASEFFDGRFTLLNSNDHLRAYRNG